ncbi:MAG: N-acetyltransferase [Oscillibacter sp.]|nr:N-acetyltransferase [Oscillibacter sp.]
MDIFRQTVGSSVIGENVRLGQGVRLGYHCVIEDDVVLGDHVLVDSNTIIRSGVVIGRNAFIGANCVIGEYQMDFIRDRESRVHTLSIGENAVIRSGSILYSGSRIGTDFQTGHHVTIRERTVIGNHVSVGTLSDIQGHCTLGNYVRLHSSVHIGMLSQIDDCVCIFPYVVLTNDPTPPSDDMRGVHICSFAIVAAHAVLLPGVTVSHDALAGAGSVVTKDVDSYKAVAGNPAKVLCDVREIRGRADGKPHYPWRYYFDRNMPWDQDGFAAWYQDLDDKAKCALFHRSTIDMLDST